MWVCGCRGVSERGSFVDARDALLYRATTPHAHGNCSVYPPPPPPLPRAPKLYLYTYAYIYVNTCVCVCIYVTNIIYHRNTCLHLRNWQRMPACSCASRKAGSMASQGLGKWRAGGAGGPPRVVGFIHTTCSYETPRPPEVSRVIVAESPYTLSDSRWVLANQCNRKTRAQGNQTSHGRHACQRLAMSCSSTRFSNTNLFLFAK